MESQIVYNTNYLRTDERLTYDIHWELLKAAETNVLTRQHVLLEDILIIADRERLAGPAILELIRKIAEEINNEVGRNENMNFGDPIQPYE